MTLEDMMTKSVTKKRPPSSLTRLQTVFESSHAMSQLIKTDQAEESKLETEEQNYEESKLGYSKS